MSALPLNVVGTTIVPAGLIHDLREIIDTARSAVAATVNAGLTMLYWRVGERVQQEILKGKRAQYGAEVISTVSRQLEAEYGIGFAEKNLRRMTQFAEVFPDEKIVVSLIRQLSSSAESMAKRGCGSARPIAGHA